MKEGFGSQPNKEQPKDDVNWREPLKGVERVQARLAARTGKPFEPGSGRERPSEAERKQEQAARMIAAQVTWSKEGYFIHMGAQAEAERQKHGLATRHYKTEQEAIEALSAMRARVKAEQ